jgi:MFS family permease
MQREARLERPDRHRVDHGYAWLRLAAAVLLSAIGGAGLWSVVVALPTVEAEFGVARAGASLPYTVTMLCFAAGGLIMGRLAGRLGIVVPIVIAAFALAIGYAAAAQATALWHFILAQGLLIGMLGASATFGPLVADISLWFERRRGLAVALVASGNYLAGTIWPPILRYMIDAAGWRQAYLVVGAVCGAAMLPLALALRPKAPLGLRTQAQVLPVSSAALGMSPSALQALLVFAGLACCIAMSMPQVHIVAYCGDLGFGTARGAEMLSIMLGFGVVSRLASGWVSDRIGGGATLLLGSVLQLLALLSYLPFDGLTSLYVVSALFGLAQGGIVPSYALIARDLFPASEAAMRVSTVLMATILGMAAGGWLSGVIFDLTGSYQAAFLHGIAWNLAHLAVAFWLWRTMRRAHLRAARPAR